jgi:hypothetical protein
MLDRLRALFGHLDPVVVPEDWAEVERLQKILQAGVATVDEMLGWAVSPGLRDDLLDLRNVLREGLPDEDEGDDGDE